MAKVTLSDMEKINLAIDKLDLKIENVQYLISKLAIKQDSMLNLLNTVGGGSVKKKSQGPNKMDKLLGVVEKMIEQKKVKVNEKELKLIRDTKNRIAKEKWEKEINYLCNKKSMDEKNEMRCSLTGKICCYEFCPLRKDKK